MTGPVIFALFCSAGLIVGSFCTNLALRTGRGEQALTGASHCEACGVKLGYVATAPVISYLALKGACAQCGSRIDPAHIVGEIAGAAIALGALTVADPRRAALMAVIGFALLTASLVDLKTKRLPDHLTLVIAVASLALAILRPSPTLLVSVIASLATFVTLGGLRRAFETLKGDPGLGFGDVKLLSALALWLGAATPIAIAIASFAGLAVFALHKPRGGRMPFGPMIAGASWVVGMGLEARWWSI